MIRTITFILLICSAVACSTTKDFAATAGVETTQKTEYIYWPSSQIKVPIDVLMSDTLIVSDGKTTVTITPQFERLNSATQNTSQHSDINTQDSVAVRSDRKISGFIVDVQTAADSAAVTHTTNTITQTQETVKTESKIEQFLFFGGIAALTLILLVPLFLLKLIFKKTVN